MSAPDDLPPVVIAAPLTGELVRLELVPDPVFSQKMVGEGIAIDPLDSILRAPCDGEVMQLHPAGHALTVLSPEGIQVLMHIGIDTIKLKGHGFTPKVKRGDLVTKGTPLIEFDLDFLATRAKSVLTLVIVANSDKIASFQYASGMVRAARDPIFTCIAKAGEADEMNEGRQRVASEAILIPNPTGLHVRTSAVLANAAKTFRSEVRLHFGTKQANAKSVTSVMELDAGQGSKVVLVARGPDAAQAIAKLTDLIQQGLGDEAHPAAPAPIPGQHAPARWPRSDDPNLIFGVAASPGIGVGNVFQIRHEEFTIVENATDAHHERQLLDAAIGKAKAQLAALQAQLNGSGDSGKGAIFAAHAELAADPALVEIAVSAIDKGKSAAFAWKSAFEGSARVLSNMHNPIIVQRADDLRDVGERVLGLITGIERKKRTYPNNAILITEELSPSDTASLDRGRVQGFCTTRGGATSHVSILARSLGIPALAGTDPSALDVRNGTLAILDANRGTLRLNASLSEMNEILELKKAAGQRYEAALAQAHAPAITLDGHTVRVLANVDATEDAAQAARLGADGIGLVRSEFLFIDRTTAPGEEDQFQTYKAIAQAIGPDRSLVIRTFDAGGDKQLAYVPIPPEENPFFGERGIRLSLDRPEFLREQLRALLRASAFGKIEIAFPMIGLLSELREARAILAGEAARLGIPAIPCGIIVEVPAAAVMASQFAKESDFLSVGTNDLAQYTLAMDRGHPKLARHVDALNPAVLRLIAQSATGAHAHRKRISVCGGIAGDEHAIPILVGLGFDELSASLPAIPSVKARIRNLRLAECRVLAEKALECDSAAAVRALVSALTPAPAPPRAAALASPA